MYAGPVCDDCASAAASAATVKLYKWTLPLALPLALQYKDNEYTIAGDRNDKAKQLVSNSILTDITVFSFVWLSICSLCLFVGAHRFLTFFDLINQEVKLNIRRR